MRQPSPLLFGGRKLAGDQITEENGNPKVLGHGYPTLAPENPECFSVLLALTHIRQLASKVVSQSALSEPINKTLNSQMLSRTGFYYTYCVLHL